MTDLCRFSLVSQGRSARRDVKVMIINAQIIFGTGMARLIFGALIGAGLIGGMAAAQESRVWVQVEAQPTLGDAQERVRAYAGEFENVAGYYLESGWYGIVLGPYSEDDARRLLNRLLATGEIPDDSFLAFGNNFEQQFWPIGTGAALDVQPLPESDGTEGGAAGDATGAEAGAAEAEPEPEPEPDETVAEARESEAALSGAEKELLQTALAWAGFYDGAIDGLYGAGTRASMEAWQAANGYDATGVLTTRQRAALIGAITRFWKGWTCNWSVTMRRGSRCRSRRGWWALPPMSRRLRVMTPRATSRRRRCC